MIGHHRGTTYESRLRGLLDELHEDHDALKNIADLGLPIRWYQQVAL